MIKCKVCQDTGAVSVAYMQAHIKAGIDSRYSMIDACPRCTYVSEIEYNSYTALRVQHGMTP